MNVLTAAGCRERRTSKMNPSEKPVAAVPAIANAKPSRAHTRTRQGKSPSSPAHRAKRNAKPVERAKKALTSRSGSKTAKILALLKRPGGASLQQLQKATGWQAHSVRGFLSGALKKKMGLRIDSAKRDGGERTYRLASK
jgi:hypothetical protein